MQTFKLVKVSTETDKQIYRIEVLVNLLESLLPKAAVASESVVIELIQAELNKLHDLITKP